MDGFNPGATYTDPRTGDTYTIVKATAKTVTYTQQWESPFGGTHIDTHRRKRNRGSSNALDGREYDYFFPREGEVLRAEWFHDPTEKNLQ